MRAFANALMSMLLIFARKFLHFMSHSSSIYTASSTPSTPSSIYKILDSQEHLLSEIALHHSSIYFIRYTPKILHTRSAWRPVEEMGETINRIGQ